MKLKTVKSVSIMNGGLAFNLFNEANNVRVTGTVIAELYREHYKSLVADHKLSYQDAMRRESLYSEDIDQEEETGTIMLTTTSVS